MPLFNKAPFKRNPPPKDLKPDDEVFFCTLTKEIFANYDEYFSRHILLNSLVWSCEQTLKSGLTYEEALQCEKQALSFVNDFPKHLKKPLLYLVSHTNRGRIDDLVADIWNFTKDRFLIGEDVDVADKNGRLPGRIVSVKMRENSEVESITSTSGKKVKEDMKAVPHTAFKYNVQVGNVMEKGVQFTSISRSKGVYKRDRLKLFLKHSCEQLADAWVVKPSTIEKYDLKDTKFSHVFAGPPPEFPKTPITKRGANFVSERLSIENDLSIIAQASKQTTPADQKSKTSKTPKTPKSPTKKLTKEFIKAKEKQAEEIKNIIMTAKCVDLPKEILMDYLKCDDDKLITSEKLNELRTLIRNKREEERERKKEERRLQEEAFREWRKPRDDLECDDLRPLPEFATLAENLDQNLLADVLALHMFLRNWWDLLERSGISVDRRGLTVDWLVDALTNNDINASTLTDLFTLLLQTVFDGQECEDGDEVGLDQKEELSVDNCDLDNRFYTEHIKNAIITAEQARDTFGVSVRNLHVDGLCITEVLRLHIESSGYYTGSNTARFRYVNRGGFRCWDDYGLMFRKSEVELMGKLKTCSLFELTIEEKLKLLSLLCDQCMTFNKFRAELDERLEKAEQMKRELKQLRTREMQNERDAAINKQIREVEMKRKEELEKIKEEGKQEEQDTPPEPDEPIRPKPSKYTKKLRVYMQNIREGSVTSARRAPFLADDGVDLLDDIRYDELELDEIILIRDIQRERFSADIAQLNQSLLNANMSIGQSVLLGRDRAHRKYYLVTSVPAILVESAEEYIADCDKQTPLDKVAYSEDLPLDQTLGHEILRTRLLACNGNSASCVVHSQAATKYVWRYVQDTETYNALLAALNNRGFRESELLLTLNSYKSELEAIVSKTAAGLESIRNLCIANQAPPSEHQLEKLVKEKLLECEEEMSLGGLGQFSKLNRNVWRENLMTNKGIEAVPKISQSLLQLAESFNLNFISGLYAHINEETDKLENTDNFRLWKESVVKCAGYSQVAVHLSSLESSVEWKKSKLKQRCRVCRKKGESGNMALCCKCSLTTHTFCLKPILVNVPGLNWKCPDCTKRDRAKGFPYKVQLTKSNHLHMLQSPTAYCVLYQCNNSLNYLWL